MDRRCDSNEGSFLTYYYREVRDARYFIIKLTLYEVNYSIIQQYPISIKEMLATLNCNDDVLIGQTLANLDGIRRERVNMRENKPWNHNGVPRNQVNSSVREIDVYQAQGNDGYKYRCKQNWGRGRYYDYPRDHNRQENYNGYQRNDLYRQLRFQLPDTRFPPPINRPPETNNYNRDATNQPSRNNAPLNSNATR